MRRIVIAVISSLTGAAAAVAQGPSSDMASLFAPGELPGGGLSSECHVPLTQFKGHAGGGAVTLTFNMDTRVAAWIRAQNGTVEVIHRKTDLTQESLLPTTGSYVTGVFTLQTSQAGDYVCASDLLLQDPQVVTHWDDTLNLGRGGQSIGAIDGLFSVNYDPQTGVLTIPQGSIENLNPSWGQGTYPVGGQYSFASDLKAIFSDGTGVHDNAAVPAFERYIGENYSTHTYTPSAAIWLSDQVRVKTGLPVAHRNAHEAFLPNSPVGEKVQDGLPLSQVLHNHVASVGSPLVPDPLGSEDSLGTLLLPPGWTSQAAPDTYPLLFTGFYDTNQSMFNPLVGIAMLDTIEEVYDHQPEARLVVGILWNGGGGIIPQGCSPSAYHGAAKLIADAESLLKADPERIVASGGSRGGTTALAVASNPLDMPYTVQYANVRDAEVRLGEAIASFSSPSHQQLSLGVEGTSGWKDAFKDAWQEPGTPPLKTGAQLALNVLFGPLGGTSDPAYVDAHQAIDSPDLRARLKDEGTRVQMTIGTHDYNKPFKEEAEYVNHLRFDDVPLSCFVFYRFGHMPPDVGLAGVGLSDGQLLDRLFPPDDLISFEEGIKHYQYDPGPPQTFHLIVPGAVNPGEVPLVFEWPMKLAPSQQHTWSFTGQPGARCQLWTRQLVSTWVPGTTPSESSFTGPPVFFPDLTLTAEHAEDVFGTWWYNFSLPISPDYYYWYGVNYSPDGDTVFEYTLGTGDIAPPWPAPYDQPLVQGVANETYGFALLTRTGGVASDGHYAPAP